MDLPLLPARPFRTRPPATLLALWVLGASFGWARDARAQLRADASAQIGVGKRFLTDAFDQPGFGPSLGLAGHVALVPLVRVGLYALHDISPVPNGPARRLYAGGVRAKVQSPWGTDRIHGWGFVGAGYVGTYGPSSSVTVVSAPTGPLSPQPTATGLSVPGAAGHFFEVPVGLGVGIRLRKPWELVFELAGRFGFGFGGDLYEGRTGVSPTAGRQTVAPLGKDVFALVLSGGVGVDL